MHALFFEVTPKPGHDDHYFGIAATLKPQVEKSGGMLFLDRYRSLIRPGTILSYQHWRDEAALLKWREDQKHMGAQKAGREKHFADYRIRIGEIFKGYSRDQASPEFTSQQVGKDTGRGLVMAVESIGQAFPRGEPFESVNRDAVHVSVLHIANLEEGEEILRDAKTQEYVTGAILCSVVRDYGMYERDEAPQDYPPVERAAT